MRGEGDTMNTQASRTFAVVFFRLQILLLVVVAIVAIAVAVMYGW
jgi:hypothetical protein